MKTTLMLFTLIVASVILYGCGSEDSKQTKDKPAATTEELADPKTETTEEPAVTKDPTEKTSPGDLIIAYDKAYRAKDYKQLCNLTSTELVDEMLQDAADNGEKTTCEKMLEQNVNSKDMFSGDTMYNITTSNPAITNENRNQLEIMEDGDTAEAEFIYVDEEDIEVSVQFSLVKEGNDWKMAQ